MKFADNFAYKNRISHNKSARIWGNVKYLPDPKEFDVNAVLHPLLSRCRWNLKFEELKRLCRDCENLKFQFCKLKNQIIF